MHTNINDTQMTKLHLIYIQRNICIYAHTHIPTPQILTEQRIISKTVTANSCGRLCYFFYLF